MLLKKFRELRAELTEYKAKFREAFVGDLAKTAAEEVEDAIDRDLAVFAEVAGVTADRLKVMFPDDPPLHDLYLLDIPMIIAPHFTTRGRLAVPFRGCISDFVL